MPPRERTWFWHGYCIFYACWTVKHGVKQANIISKLIEQIYGEIYAMGKKGCKLL